MNRKLVGETCMRSYLFVSHHTGHNSAGRGSSSSIVNLLCTRGSISTRPWSIPSANMAFIPWCNQMMAEAVLDPAMQQSCTCHPKQSSTACMLPLQLQLCIYVVANCYCCLLWFAAAVDPFKSVALPEVIEEYLDYGVAKCCAFNRRGTLLASAYAC
jgi:hypothetical protein